MFIAYYKDIKVEKKTLMKLTMIWNTLAYVENNMFEYKNNLQETINELHWSTCIGIHL